MAPTTTHIFSSKAILIVFGFCPYIVPASCVHGIHWCVWHSYIIFHFYCPRSPGGRRDWHEQLRVLALLTAMESAEWAAWIADETLHAAYIKQLSICGQASPAATIPVTCSPRKARFFCSLFMCVLFMRGRLRASVLGNMSVTSFHGIRASVVGDGGSGGMYTVYAMYGQVQGGWVILGDAKACYMKILRGADIVVECHYFFFCYLLKKPIRVKT